MLQLFNVSWRDIAQKMPELAEAGYNSLWLPPPTKASGGLSVGYDLWDPFDLGSKDQRNTIGTRYGTEAELLHMIEVAHRFGIRIYFDNIMNHRAFDIPGFNENTPIGGEGQIELYPGMVPEDFHLRKTEDGFYRKWDNTRDWGSGWQVQNLGLADLVDIAHETPNANHGPTEGSTHPKYSFVRDLERPDQYNIDKNGNISYFGVLTDQARAELGAGASAEEVRLKARSFILLNRQAFVEDVGSYLIRAVRWKMDRTKADGLRLDAVKHVPDYFFGQQGGFGKDTSDVGYLGGVQRQFNLTRGFSDSNHRDSVFDEKRGRDDAMIFGEHLGQPPGYGGYWDSGMRLVDNDLRSLLNNRLGNPNATLIGLDVSGGGGFEASKGVTHANSHDSDFAAQKEWQHAYYLTREGMGLIYSDGNNKAETLGESGGAFPRHANTQYLGQFGDRRIPNILRIHEDFARGIQQGRWADNDYLAFERRDNRNPDGSSRVGNASDEITMVMMMNDNTAQGLARGLSTSFPSNAYLYQYAEGFGETSMVGFYRFADQLGSVVVPPGGYFVFSYRTPEVSSLWTKPIALYQNGEEVQSIAVTRKDGRDGDKNFNPYGLANRGFEEGTIPPELTYRTFVPVVKGGGEVSIVARADGSAENIMIKLDGGVDLNGTRPAGITDPAFRDNPPGIRTDTFLGYEQPVFAGRQHPEKFAAVNVVRNRTGSVGAETYIKTIGGGITVNNGDGNANDYNTFGGHVAQWIFHNPEETVGGAGEEIQLSEGSSDIVIWVKSNSLGNGFQMCVYYTTDGTFPEGAGGLGRGSTKVAKLAFHHTQSSSDWWKSEAIIKPGLGSVFTYKIGAYKDVQGGLAVPAWWPSDEVAVNYKKKMMTTFRVDAFDPATVQFFPHNDYGRTPTLGQPYSNWPFAMKTGLSEGFHVLRARAFLNRGANQAPLYNTFTQVFYYDAETPRGEIRFPNAGDTIGGSSYEMVIRTDMTVDEVWYHIKDSDPTNDDVATGQLNGNGVGFEPFVDADGNRAYTPGEVFTDINRNGVYDSQLGEGWTKAIEVTPSLAIDSPLQKEWRMRYSNIPASGQGEIKIRLLEASSSRDFTQGPNEAHVTELVRTVETRGPEERVNIAWPQNDGDLVDDNYTMKVLFTKNLAEGTTTESLKERFTFSTASQTNGGEAGAVVHARDNFEITYNVSNQFHELAIPLPNLYNDVGEFLHTLKVVYRFPDGRERDGTRLVTASRSTKPFVLITRPTEVGSDGRPTEIVLPDGPGLDEIDFIVQVETNSSVKTPPILTGINTTGEPSVVLTGNSKTWSYTWNITEGGPYLIRASAELGGQETTTTRNARVILRQSVDPSGTDGGDDDNDGLININESNRKALPATNPETWSDGEVHLHFATGRSNPTSPDSDGDGLPDGLEVGWRSASPPTNASTDTNGDGFPNFIGDLDPPLYAVVGNHGFVPGVGSQSQGDDRTRQAAGTMTDPTNPDSDGDGLLDGVEDANRNGWVDGDGKPLPNSASKDQYVTHRPNLGDWPNNIIDSFETWQETSPTKGDSDGDGLLDGFGEDLNLNGRTDLFLKAEDGTLTELLISENAPFRVGGATSRAINYSALFVAYAPAGGGSSQINGWPKIIISETDPLNPDTDGDGLPDGWEVDNGLDALDNGIYNFRTGGAGNPNNGAGGDPDGDGLDNATELANGTNPNLRDEEGGGDGGEGSITIGKFTDWTHEDLLVLDEYNEGGSQAADVYRTNGFDSSRDIVAFSFRDGGAKATGGDGRLYFRVDFMDLAPNAWQGEVDAYVVIDTGNPSVGERAIPNEIDIATDMRWEAVVAVYGQNFGTIFVDTNRANNTTDQFQNPIDFGVVARGFGGVNEAAWSSRYDAVEVAVDRQHLIDAGWGGNSDTLNFQVFTTMPNTSGSGDLPGRNDIRDTIFDDWVASDFWRDQDRIRIDGKLTEFFGRGGRNDRNKSAKVILLAHGNQTIERGETVQDWVRRGNPAVGYSRLLETHEAFNAPLTLHITPTLASGLQWAKNPDAGTWPNNDGPSFNRVIEEWVGEGKISLVGSTFADHIPKYFNPEFNLANKQVSEKFLDGIYGSNAIGVSRNIFWASERVLDAEGLGVIKGMGYDYTFADQTRHFVKWFGRSGALGSAGYRLNEVNGVKIFPIHDATSEYLNSTLDEGSAIPVRQLLSRRARSDTQDQVVVLWRDLEDFSSNSKALGYEANVRWLASRPWIRLVTAGQIAGGQVQYPRQGNGQLTADWGTVNHGTGLNLRQAAQDWVDWATRGDYDNWFDKLKVQNFTADSAFGQVGKDGHANDAWSATVSTEEGNLQDVARAVIGGAMFQTAFRLPNPGQVADLSKFSTGDYVNPASLDNQSLATFARNSQGQARFAKVYERVQAWNASSNSSTHEAEQEDVDLDGEDEYLLFNSRVFAVFEKQGGRMTAAWLRDGSGKIWQVAGNFAAYSNTDAEDEGSNNKTAYRTSGFKDWYADGEGGGSSAGVNDNYVVSPAPGGAKGWTFSAGGVSKTISLPNARRGEILASYTLSGPSKLFVRFGLSPNLLDLMIRGQEGLTTEVVELGTTVSVANSSAGEVVRAWVDGPKINTAAVDTEKTTIVQRRNQAQTHQVEVEIDGAGTHLVTLGFDGGGNESDDIDGDGLPDGWELENFGNLDRDGTGDADRDGVSDLDEYIIGSNPNDSRSGFPQTTTVAGGGTFSITFPTVVGRLYTVLATGNLVSGDWDGVSNLTAGGLNPVVGDGEMKTVTENGLESHTSRFYRLKVELSR